MKVASTVLHCPNSVFDVPQVQLKFSASVGFTRKRLRAELAARDGRLAELYDAAVRLIPIMHRSGNGYLFAHAARELATAIIRSITNRPHRSRRTKKSIEKLDNVVALISLPSDHQDDNDFRRIVAIAFDSPLDDPNVSAWVKFDQTFQSSAHVATGTPTKVPDPTKLAPAFEQFEPLMYGLLAPYFDTEDELDALSRIIDPTANDVARLRPLLVRRMQRQYFFGRLTNVGWFDILCCHGLLSPSQEPATAPGESPVRWHIWPEGDYIIACAGADAATQAKVASYLQAIPASCPNPSIWTTAVRVAIELPASLAAPMVKTFAKVSNERRAYIGVDLTRLAVKLATDGELHAAFVLAYEVFCPLQQSVSPDVEQILGPRATVALLDSYEATEARQQLIPVLEQLAPERTLRFARRLLDAALAIEHGTSSTNETVLAEREPIAPNERSTGQSPYVTYSEIWAKDLTEIDDEASSAKEFFAGMVTRIACKVATDGTVAVERVLKIIASPADIYRRIELLVLARAGNEVPSRLTDSLDSLNFEHGYKWDREFAELIRQQWDAVPADSRSRFLDRIEAGPSRDRVARSMGHPNEADLDERVREWQRTMLDLFGPDLPNGDTERIQQLRHNLAWSASNRPDILTLRYPHEVGSSRWPPIPMAEDEFLALPSERVIQLCTDWLTTQQSSPAQKLTEEIFGAVHLVARYVERKSALGETVACNLIPLRYPHFLEAALEGLLNRNDEGAKVPWDVVFALARVIAEGDDIASPKVAEGTRAHRTWRDARHTVLRIINDVARQHKIPASVRDRLWQILRLIMERPDTYAMEDHTCAITARGLQLPLGTLAFAGIHATVAVACDIAELHTAGKRPSVAGRRRIERGRRAIQPALRELLELSRAAAAAFPGRRSIEAAIGRLLPTIAYMDPEWIKLIRSSILRGNANPSDAPGWVAFLTAHNHPNRHTVDLLSASYAEMAATRRFKVDYAAEDLRDVSPDAGIVRQAFANSVTGSSAFSIRTKLFRRIVNRASAEELTIGYFSVSYGLRDTAVSGRKRRKRLISHAIAGRFVQLWRWRVNSLKVNQDRSKRGTEAAGLCWLFLVDDIPEKDAVTLMRQTVVLLDHASRTAHLAWGKLARLVSQFPGDVFAIAHRLIELALLDQYPHLPNNHVQVILQFVVTQGSARSSAQARRLADRLGERGYSNFKSIAQQGDR